jgi:hypothetical protein
MGDPGGFKTIKSDISRPDPGGFVDPGGFDLGGFLCLIFGAKGEKSVRS